jgi:hypothetical protein
MGKMGLKNEQKSLGEKMEIVSRLKEISYDLERTTPGTQVYQKALIDIVGRIDTWTEGSASESGEQIKVLRREIPWLLNDMKTGKDRNDAAVMDMRRHVIDTLVQWNEFVGDSKVRKENNRI